LTPTAAVWAAVGLFAWSLLATAVGTKAAPPPSVVIVLVLGIALAAARNRRMRTTGRLLLILLAVVFATASVVAGLGWVTVLGIVLSATTGLLAIFELL
jgi:ABC-type Fe3+ transport system permease subunit